MQPRHWDIGGAACVYKLDLPSVCTRRHIFKPSTIRERPLLEAARSCSYAGRVSLKLKTCLFSVTPTSRMGSSQKTCCLHWSQPQHQEGKSCLLIPGSMFDIASRVRSRFELLRSSMQLRHQRLNIQALVSERSWRHQSGPIFIAVSQLFPHT